MIAATRDVAIIILCAETIVLMAVMLFIAWKGYQLVRLFQQKAELYSAAGLALMETAKQTAETASGAATTVKGSAEFISDTVVNPVVQVVSAVAGAKSFVSALFRLPNSARDGGRK
jgi:K+ transporter